LASPSGSVRRHRRPSEEVDGQVLLICAPEGWPSATLADSLNGLAALALAVDVGPPRLENRPWLR
jgi:hypothetical protein